MSSSVLIFCCFAPAHARSTFNFRMEGIKSLRENLAEKQKEIRKEDRVIFSKSKRIESAEEIN